jgi:hypothetical protein
MNGIMPGARSRNWIGLSLLGSKAIASTSVNFKNLMSFLKIISENIK